MLWLLIKMRLILNCVHETLVAISEFEARTVQVQSVSWTASTLNLLALI